MKILDALWFSQLGNHEQIGIVIGKDTVTGEIKCYIGTNGRQYSEADEIADRSHIAVTGAKFPIQAAKILFPEIK